MPARKYKRRSYKYTAKYKRRSKRIKRFKKIVRVFGLSIIGLILSSIAFYLYTLTTNLQKPFASASGGFDSNKVSYNSTQPFNLLLAEVTDINDKHSELLDMYLLRIEPMNNKVVLIRLPVKVQTYLNKSIGEGYINKLYSLGNSVDNKGSQYIINFLKRSLAINIDGYVFYDTNAIDKFKALNIQVDKQYLPRSIKYSYFLKISDLFTISRNNVLSDLNSIEIFKILSDTKTIDKQNYVYKELSPTELSSPKDFDFFWQSNTEYTSIFSERLLVTVLNSTDTPGLATWGSRVVKNVGANILEIGNYEKTMDETMLYTDLPETSELLKYLIHFYNIDTIYKSEDFKDDPFLAKRSDILLIMGKREALTY